MTENPEAEHVTKRQKQEERIVQRLLHLLDGQLLEKGQSSPSVRPEELTKFMRFMDSAKLIAASALLAAMLGAVYEYLTLMGVADVSPARVVLLGAWFFGALFVWEILALYKGDSKRRKRALVITLICLWTGVVYGLERWTTRWKMLHPTEVAVMEMELHEVATSVHQLTASKQTKEVQVTRNQPGLQRLVPSRDT